jgi:hypothetical protein
MKPCGLLPVLALLAACAAERSADEREDRIYRRETARIEADEAFEDKKATCARSRGVVIVNRTFSRRMRERLEDPGLATCMPGHVGAVH